MMRQLEFRRLGVRDYVVTADEMRTWTQARGPDTPDEIWFLEHEPVYTQGVSCSEPVREGASDIPLVKSDRGGQITYHGPGQLVAYLLLDLRRLGLGVRQLVSMIEASIIELLDQFGLTAVARPGAPGVYVDGEKIAALGLRVRSGCCYHGLSLNVDMELKPFSRINPCGFVGLGVTSMKEQGLSVQVDEVANALERILEARLSGKKTDLY
ncbi:MAG: lipoyl(octanoyl) transferase LipB [Pseudomonadota bacterium]|nr:lipoyl(octanoyl) transferase LipB [Pseudomonadota bacterium]